MACSVPSTLHPTSTTSSRKKNDEALDTINEECETPELEQLEARPMRERRNRWRELPHSQRVCLRRLHHMVGHASPAAIQRLLRTAGADPKAIAALNHFRCPVCETQKAQRPAPRVKMPSDYKFNVEVSIDIFIVKDVRGQKYKVLSLVDNGTLFHSAWLVGQGSGPPASSVCADKIQNGWFNWAGAP